MEEGLDAIYEIRVHASGFKSPAFCSFLPSISRQTLTPLSPSALPASIFRRTVAAPFSGERPSISEDSQPFSSRRLLQVKEATPAILFLPIISVGVYPYSGDQRTSFIPQVVCAATSSKPPPFLFLSRECAALSGSAGAAAAVLVSSLSGDVQPRRTTGDLR